MHFLKTVLSLSAITGVVLAAPAAEADNERRQQAVPANAQIVSVQWNGSGCKLGDASATMASDKSAVIISYSKYSAEDGPGKSATDRRKNCQITMKVVAPGWVHTISDTTFRGFTDMDKGKCAGYVKASYFFPADKSHKTASATYNFPKNAYGNYQATTTVGATWPACGKGELFVINSEAVIKCGGGGSGEITVDSIEHVYVETYRLWWKKC